MSDGNFNRALLPKGELSAGLRVGKAQMRQRATEAFEKVLAECAISISEEEKARMRSRFVQLLRN